MAGRYPEIEPYEHGMLDVGDGHLVYWEACGNPRGQTGGGAAWRARLRVRPRRPPLLGRLTPEAWARFRDGVPASDRCRP